MEKSSLIIFLLLLLGLNLWAEEGTILVRGATGKVVVYNAERGRERTKFEAPEKGKVQKISIPGKQCGELLYLIADGTTSWVRLNPEETVEVNVTKLPWKFSGDNKQVNQYLYSWTQDFWFDRPNMLTGTVQMMFLEVPDEKKQFPAHEEIYMPEYMAWVAGWERNALSALEKAGLKDTAFVAGQRDRIHYSWLELQFANYQIAKDDVKVPAMAMEFCRHLRFEKDNMLGYPGRENIFSGYFNMADQMGLLDFSASDFLQKRAGQIANPRLREAYILGELENTFTRGNVYYQGDQLLASVKDGIVSEDGRKKWQEYADKYQEWATSKENPAGKNLTYFDFEDYTGKMVNPTMFKGKYLLIDVWATWCAPCKYQIPYLKKLAKEMEGKDIAFLSVSVDKQKDKEKWKTMLKEYGLEDHGVIAPDAFEHVFFKNYKINSIPRFILVDPNGKVVTDRARRPSDVVLKKQLDALLAQYDQKKVTVSGEVGAKDGDMVNILKPGMMANMIGQVTVREGKFVLTAEIPEPGFYSLGCGKEFRGEVWMEPGQRMAFTTKGPQRFSGDGADFNNLMYTLIWKYKTQPAAKDEMYDKARGRRLRDMYDSIERDIMASSLSDQKKQVMKGYWQGYLLNQMYGSAFRAKVFGKIFKAPEMKKGYSSAILDLQWVPELVCYNGWIDYLQEFLYAQLEAGKIKIRTEDSWLADLAGGIQEEDLRESYIMETLRLDILRGLLQGIEARIESVRPDVRKAENRQLLDVMPEQIAQEREKYAQALPGTDLTMYEFENDKGQMVSLGDFKGKYVFIDLWSTGCNPCVGEMPYIRTMEHRFAGKPIAWVSISMDLNKKEWLDFMKKNDMKGVQLLCSKGFKHPFIQQIGLSGIPRFVLLDKEGKVLDVNTLRPSNPVLAELLRLLLANK